MGNQLRLLFMTLVSLMILGCNEPETAVQITPEVSVIVTEPRDVPIFSEFVGKTVSSRRIEIRSRVEGFLEKRLYEEGTMVEEGQVMFRMDRKPFEAQLSAANAELAQQQARLDNAEANLARVKPLAEQNAVAQKELDDAIGMFRSSAAAVEAANAKVMQAELDLGYTDIYSPVTGVSSFARKREGSYIGIGQDSLLTYVARIQPMWVEFSISENQIFSKRAKQKSGLVRPPEADRYEVEIILADQSSYPHRGQITFADASLSEETGTFLIRAEIPNPNRELRPGQFVRAQIHGAIRPDAILIPQRAVQQGAQGSFVWVIEEGKTRFQPVKTGPWLGDDWFIEGGLEGGEQIIVDGALTVRPDIEVTTVPYQAANKAGKG
ncbi:MAG: efflux RND transporter periplasmic adaptor subunit [Gammaproteobacteria bacterium]|nr:efflux RND transporter periplasmic adaptor subunit [Gammaproteobacteria bacterium]